MRTILLYVTGSLVGSVLFASRAEAEVMSLDIASSVMVQMIDGTGDDNSTVSVGVMSVNNYDFGYWDDSSDAFVAITNEWNFWGSATFSGGSLVDFAIRDNESGGEISRLSDHSAVMRYWSPIEAENSENPVVNGDYWQNLSITWDLGSDSVVATIYGSSDGFAPVPEPASLALLGVGALAAATVVGRRRKSRAGKSRS